MRTRLITLVALLTACASASPPPGGAEDKVPPRLVKVTPDTNAVNVRAENVVFQFDETISDRGTGEGEVDNFFLVSPSDGRPRVYWHRNHIDVRPRNGFRPNTAYTVTLLPGLTDLHANKMKDGATLVFSTGATIPKERITGIAFDWAAEHGAARAYIEAITPDSIIYLAQADSMGRFTIGPLGPGNYLVRAIMDANNNRVLDRNEFFDTLRVTVPQAAPAELLAAARDTLAARLLTVSVVDSLKLTVTFDRLLDPRQTLAVEQFRLVTADSAAVAIASVMTSRQEKAADSVAAKVAGDSARRADSLSGKALPAIRQAAPPAAAPPRAGAAAPPAPPPKPSLPPPFTVVTVKLRQPLAANTPYRLSVTGVRGLSGRVQASERSFTTPKPQPPKLAKDSASVAKPAAPAATPPKAPPTAPPTAPPGAPVRTPPAR